MNKDDVMDMSQNVGITEQNTNARRQMQKTLWRMSNATIFNKTDNGTIANATQPFETDKSQNLRMHKNVVRGFVNHVEYINEKIHTKDLHNRKRRHANDLKKSLGKRIINSNIR